MIYSAFDSFDLGVCVLMRLLPLEEQEKKL